MAHGVKRWAVAIAGTLVVVGIPFGAAAVERISEQGAATEAAVAEGADAAGGTGGTAAKADGADDAVDPFEPLDPDAGTPVEPAVDATRIMLLGDSVTQGAGGDWTWRYRLARTLDTAGTAYDFVGPRQVLYDPLTQKSTSSAYLDPAFDQDHVARWGMTLAEQDFPVTTLVTDLRPDVLVEMLGVNDLNHRGDDPAVVAQRVRQLVADARAASPTVDVVLVELPQTWVEGVDEFNAFIHQMALELDTPDARVVSASTAGATPAHTRDGMHPNADGELLIADGVARALQRIGVPTQRRSPTASLRS
ncbi:SGNH/GDSL hydrolase family protein [Nocardioides sp. CPCC 205120]|uniref:SGNH/GDSL hydrolase family protein n=1 Tax=Nocardioides sp. CPCC 205120 TaxID=3406462 RepID=UPI003B50DD34